MKVHRILAEGALGLVRAVFRDKLVLDREVSASFEANPKWGRRDRSFVAETAYEVVRWRNTLEFLSGQSDAAAWCAVQWMQMGLDVPDWWAWQRITAEELAKRQNQLAEQPRTIRESVPEWLDQLGEAELGARWSDELSALNQRARVFLRVNLLACDLPSCREWLAAQGVETELVPGVKSALVLAEGKTLPKPLRLDGRVEIQDAGSQLIAPMLGAQPGETVIDACAGAGGKTLQLAAMMWNQGKLYALDVDAGKLAELKRRARRARATMISTAAIREDTIDGFAGMADRLLLDAPCSGLGTLKRQPDLKWRLKPAELDRIRAVQRDLLERHTRMLKPGGTLVYATCSLLPSENRRALDGLLESGRFTLETEQTISPAGHGFDGFYAARLRRME
jgi:16S rRNA (cytosine967-C5)-methyltransferase